MASNKQAQRDAIATDLFNQFFQSFQNVIQPRKKRDTSSLKSFKSEVQHMQVTLGVVVDKLMREFQLRVDDRSLDINAVRKQVLLAVSRELQRVEDEFRKLQASGASAKPASLSVRPASVKKLLQDVVDSKMQAGVMQGSAKEMIAAADTSMDVLADNFRQYDHGLRSNLHNRVTSLRHAAANLMNNARKVDQRY